MQELSERTARGAVRDVQDGHAAAHLPALPLRAPHPQGPAKVGTTRTSEGLTRKFNGLARKFKPTVGFAQPGTVLFCARTLRRIRSRTKKNRPQLCVPPVCEGMRFRFILRWGISGNERDFFVSLRCQKDPEDTSLCLTLKNQVSC